MLILNFSHPLTDAQLAQVTALADEPIIQTRDILTQLDPAQPFTQQVVALVESVGLTPAEWQTLPLLSARLRPRPPRSHPPGRAPRPDGLFASTVLRSAPGRRAHPAALWVAEIINLQAVRDAARARTEENP